MLIRTVQLCEVGGQAGCENSHEQTIPLTCYTNGPQKFSSVLGFALFGDGSND